MIIYKDKSFLKMDLYPNSICYYNLENNYTKFLLCTCDTYRTCFKSDSNTGISASNIGCFANTIFASDVYINILGIPIISMDYTSTVIPVIFIVYFALKQKEPNFTVRFLYTKNIAVNNKFGVVPIKHRRRCRLSAQTTLLFIGIHIPLARNNK